MRDIVTTAAATLFYGRHSVHGLIAIKSLRQAPSPTRPVVPTFAQYWETEKQLLQHVSHPSIVKFMGADARFFSIYMEYLPYPDLTGLMTKPGYFFTGSLDDATRILRDMSSALAYLKEKNMLHNDIKPANILYDESRGAVLIDFGLASFDGKVCNGGTPWYVPQEYMTLRKRGFESDVFALGVTGLYLLKRSSLPESQGRPWAVANAKLGTEDGSCMEVWLASVGEMERSLNAENEIEATVGEMLLPDPKHRITAKEAYKRLSC